MRAGPSGPARGHRPGPLVQGRATRSKGNHGRAGGAGRTGARRPGASPSGPCGTTRPAGLRAGTPPGSPCRAAAGSMFPAPAPAPRRPRSHGPPRSECAMSRCALGDWGRLGRAVTAGIRAAPGLGVTRRRGCQGGDAGRAADWFVGLGQPPNSPRRSVVPSWRAQGRTGSNTFRSPRWSPGS